MEQYRCVHGVTLAIHWQLCLGNLEVLTKSAQRAAGKRGISGWGPTTNQYFKVLWHLEIHPSNMKSFTLPSGSKPKQTSSLCLNVYKKAIWGKFYPTDFKGTICNEKLCSLKTLFLVQHLEKATDGFSQKNLKTPFLGKQQHIPTTAQSILHQKVFYASVRNYRNYSNTP